MERITNILEKLKIPFEYDYFKEKTSIPYITYRELASSNFGADNIVYKDINNLVIELYDNHRNISLERKLEALLSEHMFYYEKDFNTVEEENIYMVSYYITII